MRKMVIAIALAAGAMIAAPVSAQNSASSGAYASSALQRGDLVQAEMALEAQRRASPDMPEVLLNLATVFARTNRDARAVDMYRRVLAQDIDQAVLTRLGERVARDRLDNVSIKLGAPDDPRLPEASFDRVFMVHMYHEIAQPYAFLWRLRPALKPDGEVIVVDADRPTNRHGTPPALLTCELEAVGYTRTGFELRPDIGAYIARFRPSGERPDPGAIQPCPAPEPAAG